MNLETKQVREDSLDLPLASTGKVENLRLIIAPALMPSDAIICVPIMAIMKRKAIIAAVTISALGQQG